MKFKMTIFTVLVIVIFAGCGVKPEKQSDNNGIAITVDAKLSNPLKEQEKQIHRLFTNLM
jgi:ABC-type molybdate transport system substrate-binding protein